MIDVSRVVAIVLAAGAGSRFGGGKLVAPLAGRPLVAHAVTTAMASGIGRVVVVLGAEADAVEAALLADGLLPPAATAAEAASDGATSAGDEGGAMDVAGPARADGDAFDRETLPGTTCVVAVRNDAWATGLASSVRAGLRAAAATSPFAVEAALILLGDQPSVRPATIARLLGSGLGPVRPIAVARHGTDGAPNPVLLHRSAWGLADDLRGDRGLGPLIAERPELVTVVRVDDENPDVDTPGDLAVAAATREASPMEAAGAGGSSASTPRWIARGAEAAWAARVRANAEQSARCRETPEGGDFYAPVAGVFVVDPHRAGDGVLDALLALAEPSDRWLDIGAGAGRFALPLALRVREVIALDPSPSMLAGLREGMARHDIANVVPVEGRWPPSDPDAAEAARADVALIAHVGYDIEPIGAFLDAMEAAAGRLCVAVLSERVPSSPAAPFWPPVHGEARIELPALGPFLDVVAARGAEPRVALVPHTPRAWSSREELATWVRHQLFIDAGSERDRVAQACVDAWTTETADGLLLGQSTAVRHGVVSWSPPRARRRSGS
jgi:CTP:molybdopterin cytidylyltransferase MocA/SAM-dependent methyltransferase